ncbi:MAG: hypothetical protein ABR592_11585 [Nitriliruptorales bacterium]
MPRITRLLAAALILAGGSMHLMLWQTGYRDLPYIGPLFLVNIVASAALALALVASRSGWTAAGAAFLSAGSLVALILSRTVGLLGFVEKVWTPMAVRVLLTEVGVLVVLGLSLVRRSSSSAHAVRVDPSPRA